VLVLAGLLALSSIGIALIVRGWMLRSSLDRLTVRNFRGVDLPVAGGIVIISGLLMAEVILTLIALIRTGTLEGGHPAYSPSAIPQTFLSFDNAGLLILVLGFFGLGLFDDLAGGERAGGFKGHIGSLVKGRMTTGAVKAIGGVGLAFVVGGLWELRLVPAFVDALVIALSANLVNLLDLRPGRAVKGFFLAWIPLAFIAWADPYLAASAPVAGAAAAWLPADLKERGMLGDSGSNLLGAVVGGGVALQATMGTKLIVLAVLVSLTLVSERWSFSKAISKIPPLRWVDQAGRKRPLEPV